MGVKFIEEESSIVVARNWERGEGESGFNQYRVSIWEDKKNSVNVWW